MSSLVRRRREGRQIASRRPFGDLPIRIKGRSVTLTVERSVWLGRQLTFPMRAERGKRKKFFAFADDKESLVPEACVDAVAGVTARRTGVHYPFCRASLGNRLAACERGGRQNQELSSSNVFAHQVVSLN